MSEAMHWLDMLRSRVDSLGSIRAVADELGYARCSVSLALSGKYPAKVTRLEASVLAAYTRCACPYLGIEITAAACRTFRTRPIPQSSPGDLRHWSHCQQCPVGRDLAAAEALRRNAHA